MSGATAKNHPADKLEKYGQTGKPLRNMPSIKAIVPVMLCGLPNCVFKSALSQRIHAAAVLNHAGSIEKSPSLWKNANGWD